LFCFLSQIIWENQKKHDVGRDCLCNVDHVDCLTTKQGHKKAYKSFYSHKFKTLALRYGLATCIETGYIVHIDGPHPPGDWPDVECFRIYMKPKLDRGERVEADDGYIGEDPTFVVAASGLRFMESEAQTNVRKTLRMRHETVNERIKQFAVLTDRFRHDILKHGDCFFFLHALCSLKLCSITTSIHLV
jgi:hypothetical protein